MTIPVKLSAFEAALAEQLPEGDLRAELEGRGLPHRRVEDWKWSDLRAALARLPADTGELTLTASRSPDARRPLMDEPDRLMARLAAALGGPAEVFDLHNGETLNLDASVASGAGHRTIVVRARDGVNVTVRERYTAAPGAMLNLSIHYVIAPRARLTRIIEQDASPDAVIVVTTMMDMSPRAHAAQTTLGFGAKLARLETHVSHAGQGASLEMNGAYLVGEGLHLDQTGIVRHTGPGGTTRELFKGAAAHGGRGVFQGKIHVERAAQKTDASMNHRGLLLDGRSEIDAKPELEIYADDVVCAHGNALGAMDAAALFYMRQRGLNKARARALLTQSFLAEPLERLEDEAVREALMARLQAVLESVS
ncbi:MAG: SufD family Fe-S cluster assembly protein [Oceanicaulis sp.]|nr:SufD family Fe-S cluster assembly protein [Oceanicaulis sp.]